MVQLINSPAYLISLYISQSGIAIELQEHSQWMESNLTVQSIKYMLHEISRYIQVTIQYMHDIYYLQITLRWKRTERLYCDKKISQLKYR